MADTSETMSISSKSIDGKSAPAAEGSSASGAGKDVHLKPLDLYVWSHLVKDGEKWVSIEMARASDAELERERQKLNDHARALVYARIPDRSPIGDEEIAAVRKAIERIAADEKPRAQLSVHDATQAVECLEQERNALPAKPPEPNRRVFLTVGGLLGVVFGLFASVTLSEFIQVVLGLGEEDQRAFAVLLGVVFGLLIGVVVGTVTIAVSQFVSFSKATIRWLPGIAGLLLALGLGGFRLIHTDPKTGDISATLTAVGVGLMFVEIAILVFIEFVNHVYMSACEKWEAATTEHRRLEGAIARAKEDVAYHAKRLEKLTAKEAEETAKLRAMHEKIHEWTRALSNRDEWVKRAYQDLLTGFEHRLATIRTVTT